MFDTIIKNWDQKHTEMFGQHTLRLQHRLHESDLFTDIALAKLIERYPETHYNLHSMGSPEDPRVTWKRGLIGDCPGMEVIRGIRDGRLWLNLRRVHEVDQRYARVLDQMFAEFEAHVPGLATFKHNFGILISSPRAQVYYHADIPGQSLWQVRGSKRVWIYPNTAPFLREQDLEKAILGLTEEEIPYEPWFDEYAEVYDLEPGQMLHWALNGPHRVVNHHCLNVSVTTEHWTRDIRNQYAARYANGLLRKVGLKPGVSTRGPGLYAKAALVAAHRKFLRKPVAAVAARYDFKMDAQSMERMVELPDAAE